MIVVQWEVLHPLRKREGVTGDLYVHVGPAPCQSSDPLAQGGHEGPGPGVYLVRILRKVGDCGAVGGAASVAQEWESAGVTCMCMWVLHLVNRPTPAGPGRR